MLLSKYCRETQSAYIHTNIHQEIIIILVDQANNATKIEYMNMVDNII